MVSIQGSDLNQVNDASETAGGCGDRERQKLRQSGAADRKGDRDSPNWVITKDV